MAASSSTGGRGGPRAARRGSPYSATRPQAGGPTEATELTESMLRDLVGVPSGSLAHVDAAEIIFIPLTDFSALKLCPYLKRITRTCFPPLLLIANAIPSCTSVNECTAVACTS